MDWDEISELYAQAHQLAMRIEVLRFSERGPDVIDDHTGEMLRRAIYDGHHVLDRFEGK